MGWNIPRTFPSIYQSTGLKHALLGKPVLHVPNQVYDELPVRIYRPAIQFLIIPRSEDRSPST